MALSFQYRSASLSAAHPARVAIFPGAWNPPTVAHLAIARAAAAWADELVLALPRAFPHKEFEGVAFDDRVSILRQLAAPEGAFSVALFEGGLYVEMADEARECFGPDVEIGLVCGRDAAERVAAWEYGRPSVFESMLRRYPLLVAARAGDFVPAPRHAARVLTLPVSDAFSEVSSSDVRERMARGDPWQHLVPESIVRSVAALYRRWDERE